MSPSAYAGVIISVVVAFLSMEYLFFRAFGKSIFDQNKSIGIRIRDGLIFWFVTFALIAIAVLIFRAAVLS